VRLEQWIDEIHKKQAAGEPLRPTMKKYEWHLPPGLKYDVDGVEVAAQRSRDVTRLRSSPTLDSV